MRNREDRQQCEQKLRHAKQEWDQVHEFFGTNNPNKIRDFLNERRQTMATLSQQICRDLEAAINRLKS
jgi:hypothetical protein